MEFTPTQIAALVLGYLKSEKCFGAYHAFLKTSEFFQNPKRGKFIATRVMGKRLIDFLEEYAEIYTNVQARLEASNYYNEKHSNAELIDQIIYLLDNAGIIGNSSPILNANEFETTPSHALPGNNPQESDEVLIDKTPKRKSSRTRSANNKNLDKNDVIDVSEVISQTFLNHELHEKLAETINTVRNTPEIAKTTSDEQVSAGASRELEAIIKTVVQRTEEDPCYNKLIDEIIGTTHHADNGNVKKTQNHPSVTTLPEEPKSGSEPTPAPDIAEPPAKDNPTNSESERTVSAIDEHNNDAVRSIIAAAQTPTKAQQPQAGEAQITNNEVFLYDGTLDSYLKTSANPVVTNPVYINTTGGLFMMPQIQEPQSQFYIVNNQPMINLPGAVKSVITDKDILAMPTVIINEEAAPILSTVAQPVEPSKKLKRIESKALKPREKKTKSVVVTKQPVTLTLTQTTPASSNSSASGKTQARPQSAVRNLDFSSPPAQPLEPPVNTDKKQTILDNGRTWDADLRSIVGDHKTRSPTPKKKKPVSTRPKKKTIKNDKKAQEDSKNKAQEQDKGVNKTEVETSAVKQEEKHNKTPPDKEIPKVEVDDVCRAHLETPLKDMIPKTPGFPSSTSFSQYHCTPINDVIEEHLKGVDLISMPTPQFPITPGFALTPAEGAAYGRSTDYSTSSSYYQPSDTEQNKSIEKLIEESRCKTKSKPSIANLKIVASEVVIETAQDESTEISSKSEISEAKNCNEMLKTFNTMVVGKKNLNLLATDNSSSSSCSSSSSDSSDTDSDSPLSNQVNKTVIHKNSETDQISNIINNVEVKPTLQENNVKKDDDGDGKKKLLTHLEAVRQRTFKKLQQQTIPSKKSSTRTTNNTHKNKMTNNVAKAKTRNTRSTRKSPVRKKKETSNDESDDESGKLVKGLAQRGIHLVPNKTSVKNKKVTEKEVDKVKTPEPVKKILDLSLNDNEVIFDQIELTESTDFVFNERLYTKKKKNLTDYNFECLSKTFKFNLFVEELKGEVERCMKWTDIDLISIVEEKEAPIQNSEDGYNDLMDFAASGGSPKKASVNKGNKKRKRSVEEAQVENKCQKLDKGIQLCKNLDVDRFLDQVHGE